MVMDEAMHEKMDKILKALSKKKDGGVEASLKYIIKQQKNAAAYLFLRDWQTNRSIMDTLFDRTLDEPDTLLYLYCSRAINQFSTLASDLQQKYIKIASLSERKSLQSVIPIEDFESRASQCQIFAIQYLLTAVNTPEVDQALTNAVFALGRNYEVSKNPQAIAALKAMASDRLLQNRRPKTHATLLSVCKNSMLSEHLNFSR